MALTLNATAKGRNIMLTKELILSKTDARGRLNIDGVHDAILCSFDYNMRRYLRFSLKADDGRMTSFELEKPIVLNVASLCEGTTVDTIFIWDVSLLPDDIWNEPENAWRALLESRVHQPALRERAARLTASHPKALLMVVSCSYGGDWSALVTSMTISTK